MGPTGGLPVKDSKVAQAQPDLLAELERDVPDRNVPLADLLLRCVILAGQTGAPQPEEWATAELNGYPGREVPGYRRAAVPIMQIIEGLYGSQIKQPLNVQTVPDFAREYITENLPFNQGVHELEAMAGQAEAQGKQIDLAVFAGDVYMEVWNSRHDRPYTMLALYWPVDPVVIRGVLGRARTALAAFVARLRKEIGPGGDLPSAEQTDDVLRTVVGSAVISNMNVFTGNAQSGDIVTNQPANEYNFGDVTGNVAAGSSGFSQTYNAVGLDVGQFREFADLVLQIVGTLGLEPDQRDELEADAVELRAIAAGPVAEPGKLKKAWGAVMGKLSLAGSTAASRLAIEMGNQLGAGLDEAIIHHIPH
jgi:hypothetical protein